MYQFTGRAYDLDEEETVQNEIVLNIIANDEAEALEKVPQIVTRQHYEFTKAKEISLGD